MLLPVSVLGKIIYKEGIFVFAVFGSGLLLHSISVKKVFHIYYMLGVEKKCIFSAIIGFIFWSIEIFFVSLQAIWCEHTAIIVSIALIIN